MIDSLYYDGNCSCGCNGPHFSNAAPMVPLNIIEAFKRRVYDGMKRGTIDKQMWQAVLHVVSEGIVDGLMESGAATHEEAFLRELRHSAEVFSAFKVHTMADSMRSMLVKPNGRLKSFSEWSNDVAPIAAHHVGSWLQTEYDTAVIRAHNAADWQEFERNKDIMPNLRWMPTTSPHPESSHKVFWQKQLTLPVDDEFWAQHHPGDRWNCKCSLEATDEPATPELKAELSGENMPQRGLENNPGKDAHVFNDTHPYFPKSCEQCAFYKPGIKNRLKLLFKNKAKDCYNCPYIGGCISRMANNGFKLEQSFSNGGKLYVHPNVDKDKDDWKAMKRICLQFAKEGNEVKMTPRVHRKSQDYEQIYSSLIGTRYENKCPDFSVNGVFYEYEGFKNPWTKRKIKNMLSHGMEQSPYVVINNSHGCSDRMLRKAIINRTHGNNGELKEVWVYEKGETRAFYKDGKFI